MQLLHPEEPETQSQDALPVSEEVGTVEPEGNEGLPGMAKGLARGHKARIRAQKAEIRGLRISKNKYARKYEVAKKRIAGLEDKVMKASRVHQQNLERQDKHIQAIEDELARAQELLSARTKELSGAQSFLSTTDRLPEAEVLGIVRDLNENIFQVATNLAEQWEKLALSLSARLSITPENSLDDFSRFYGPTLIRRSFQWDPTAVTYLVQSCLCYFVMDITSSWRCRDHGEELKILASVYERLFTSEGQAISARWKSLTHSHLIKPSSPHTSTSMTKHIANILWITGTFQSLEDSLDFVKVNASNRLEIIYQLASRLESAFMVDVTSCDMYLLCEAPLTTFNDARMTKEFESDDSSPSQKRDKVAGTAGVGVEKRVWGRSGEDLRVEVLLKATMVMEEDFEES